jgi:hypothetical protein
MMNYQPTSSDFHGNGSSSWGDGHDFIGNDTYDNVAITSLVNCQFADSHRLELHISQEQVHQSIEYSDLPYYPPNNLVEIRNSVGCDDDAITSSVDWYDVDESRTERPSSFEQEIFQPLDISSNC